MGFRSFIAPPTFSVQDHAWVKFPDFFFWGGTFNTCPADIRSEKLCFIAVKVFFIMIVHGQLTRICDYVNALRQLWLSSTCGPLCKGNATQEYSSTDHSCCTFLFTLLLFICQRVKHYEEINNCI